MDVFLKKNYAKIIFFLALVSVTTAFFLNSLYRQEVMRGRALTIEQLQLNFIPGKVTAAAGTKFTTTIQLTHPLEFVSQGYDFIVNFDKQYLQVTDVTYKMQAVPDADGDSNSTLQRINDSGQIVTKAHFPANAYPIFMPDQIYDIVSVTFNVINAQTATTVRVNNADMAPHFFIRDLGSAGGFEQVNAVSDQLVVNSAAPTEGPTPTTEPGMHRISGRYIDIGLSPTPADCSTAGGNSNGLNMYDVILNPLDRHAYTQDYQGQGGAFLFYNVPNGTYSMVGEVPPYLTYTCSYSPTNGSTRGPGPTVTVNGADVSGVKFVFRQTGAQPSATPTVTPPSPTPTCNPNIEAPCYGASPTKGVSATPTPITPTPLSTGNTVINMKVRLQGITAKPRNTQNLTMKLTVKGGLLTSDVVQETLFYPNIDGTYTGKLVFDLPLNPFDRINKYSIYIKGPKHLQKRICDMTPTETAGGYYHCLSDNIQLDQGTYDFDFSGVVLLAGDLPISSGSQAGPAIGSQQNGVIDSEDTAFIRQNFGRDVTGDDISARADLNLDNFVDTQDYSLVIAALSIKYDDPVPP